MSAPVLPPRPPHREPHTEPSLAPLAIAAFDRAAELAREHIELARVRVGTELRITAERALAFGAAAVLGIVVAVVLLVAALFALAGAILPSVGARLVLLALVTAAASGCAVLVGSGRARLLADKETGPERAVH